MTPKQARLLAESLKKIESRLYDFGSLVHERLFEISPESRRLFKGDLEEQKLKMARAFAEFVRLKARPHPFMPVTGKAGEAILPGIGALGARHELDYGVRSKHFSYMREALLYAIRVLHGREYNDEIGLAWSETFDMLADAMQKQAGDSREAVAFLRLSHRRSPASKPPLVPWSDKLSVGVELIDSEHKRLVNLLNELNSAVEEGAGMGALSGILNGLINYTVYHFTHEEDLARRSRFPGYERHRQQHEGFKAKVLQVHVNFQSGASTGLPGEVLEFLKSWLSQHILGSDRELGAYLNANPGALGRE